MIAPAAAIYGAVAARRMARAGARAAIPIVCLGNVTVGGSGKTPAAIAVAALLRDLGRRPAFLTRGHGGRLPGPVLVRPGLHGPDEAGDEPLLLARHAPTFIARDRAAGAALAAGGGADVVVMDDGLQNPSLAKDLSIAVFDGAVGTGNGRVVPAGPLRAPLPAQWPRIDAVLVIGGGRAGREVAADAVARGLPVLRGRLAPEPERAAALAGRRVLAFAGIGRPEKFFATLREIGAEVAEARPFPDHHRYTAGELSRMAADAARRGLLLVTTEKDAVKLPATFGAETLPVALRFDDEPAMRALLSGALGKARRVPRPGP